MKIGIIDNDLCFRKGHAFPNLACMKLSAYYKNRGHVVRLITFDDVDPSFMFCEKFDKVFVSKAFTDTHTPEFIDKMDNVETGGTGFFYEKAPPLPCEVEHSMPDYSLYSGMIGIINKPKYYTDYSIGYTTRGCFRGCEFCVNKNLKKVNLHSPVDEFVEDSRPKIALLDDNILGIPDKKLFDVFDKLGATGKAVQYKQGMDIRLMTEERAKKIFELKYEGDYHFAFDLWKYKYEVEKKLSLWRKCYETYKSSNRKYHIGTRVYVFTGLDSSGKYDEAFWLRDVELLFRRISICFEHKTIPYVMRYHTVDKCAFRNLYINIAQWANHPGLPCISSSFLEFVEDGSFQTKKSAEFIAKYQQFNNLFMAKL